MSYSVANVSRKTESLIDGAPSMSDPGPPGGGHTLCKLLTDIAIPGVSVRSIYVREAMAIVCLLITLSWVAHCVCVICQILDLLMH